MDTTYLEVELEVEVTTHDVGTGEIPRVTPEENLEQRSAERESFITESVNDGVSEFTVPITSVYPVLPANIVSSNIEDLPEAHVILNEDDENVRFFFVPRDWLKEKTLLIFIGMIAFSIFISGLFLYGFRRDLGANVKWKPSINVLNGTDPNQYFGADFAISHDGKRLGAMGFGRKYFYEDNGTDWVQIGRSVCFCKEFWGDDFALEIPEHLREFSLIGFGMASSFDGNRFVVGVSYTNFSAAIAVDWNDATSDWDLVRTFYPESKADEFAVCLDMSYDGNRIVIVSASGSISIYDNIQVNSTVFEWRKMTIELTDEEIIRSTKSKYMALSGDGKRFAIGNYMGVKVLEEKSNGQWEQLGDYLYGSNGFDKFGDSVDLSEDGSRLVVGAPGFSKGYAIVFDYSRTDNKWNQVGSRITGTFPGDRYGFSVSISSDGRRLAVGAFGGGPNVLAGYMVLYEFVAGAWFQIGDSINGTRPGDRFGFRVLLSPDKNRVTTSAILANVDSVEEAGQIYSYDFDWL